MVQIIGFTASTQIFDPATGRFTGEGFRLIQFIVQSVNGDAAVVTTDGIQTLTNKTIDGDNNTLSDIATSSLKTRTGVIGRVVTGSAGSAGTLAGWDANGDLVGGSIAISNLLTDADIGSTVQPFDATILNAADIGVTVQPYNASTLDGSDIGVLVQAYDPDLTNWAGKTAPSGTVVGTTDAQTLTNKTLQDSTTAFADEGDATKRLAFQISGITTGTTRTVTAQNKSGTMALLEGTATNDNAAAGQVGEIVSSTVVAGSAIALTATIPVNVTSISLTAGDWDVSGSVQFTPGATTSITVLQGSISLTTATIDATPGQLMAHRAGAFVPGAFPIAYPVGVVRMSLAATTTVYLVAQGNFTVSTLSAYGTIRARRVR